MEQEELTKYWKENGIPRDLYALYVNDYTNQGLEPYECWIDVVIPVQPGTDMSIKIKASKGHIAYNEKMKIDVIDFAMEHLYDVYITEVIRSNLPVWNDGLLPDSAVDHIIEEYTLGGRIGYLYAELGCDIQHKHKNLHKMVDIIRNKLILGGKLTKEDEEVAGYFEKWGGGYNRSIRWSSWDNYTPDFYPRHMSEQQIRKTIRSVYHNAWEKQSRKTRLTGKDGDIMRIPNDELQYRERQAFQGDGGQLTIEIVFSFADGVIETAYPLK